MKSNLMEELEAMRRKHACLRERWEEAKDLLAGKDCVVPVPPEFFAQLDRACEGVTPRRPTHAPSNLQSGAIRA